MAKVTSYERVTTAAGIALVDPKNLTARLTEDELHFLDRAAAKVGVSRSKFIAAWVMAGAEDVLGEAPPKPQIDPAQRAELEKTFARVAAALGIAAPLPEAVTRQRPRKPPSKSDTYESDKLIPVARKRSVPPPKRGTGNGHNSR